MRFLVFTMAVLMALPATAQTASRDEVIDGLAKCAAVTDGTARLACYDKLAPQVKEAAEAPPPPPPMVQTAPPPSDTSLLSSLNPFGGSGTAAGPSQVQMGYQPIGSEILPVTIGVKDYSVAPSRSFTVTLDNGQVWREHDRDFETPRFKTDGKNVATISRGLLGGFSLSLQGSGKVYKVVRVQ